MLPQSTLLLLCHLCSKAHVSRGGTDKRGKEGQGDVPRWHHLYAWALRPWTRCHKSSSTASPACCGLAARHRARESQPVSHSASTNVDSAKPKLWPSAFAEHGAWDCGCIFSTHTLSWSLTGMFMQNSFAGFLILCRQNNVSAGIALLSERSNHLQQRFQSEGLQGQLRALQSQRGCLKERPLDLAPKPVKHFKYVT